MAYLDLAIAGGWAMNGAWVLDDGLASAIFYSFGSGESSASSEASLKVSPGESVVIDLRKAESAWTLFLAIFWLKNGLIFFYSIEFCFLTYGKLVGGELLFRPNDLGL